jgi:flagellar hook-associated protein 1 FlgK
MNIGLSGLTAQQLALDVTSDNITNVDTPGYSEQTAELATGPTTVNNGLALGNGVQVTTVQRSYDSFLQSQMVAANAASGQATTTNSTLTMVQTQFNDLNSAGLSTSLQGFFSAWQSLSTDPTGVPERQAVISAGQQLADNFNQVSTSLTGEQTSLNQSLTGLTSTINTQLSQVAQLNGQIEEAQAEGGQANDMLDQRDLLVQQLATNVGVTSTVQSNGTVNVNLTSGQALVTGTNSATLSLQANAANSGNYDVYLSPPGGGSAADATSYIGGPSNSLGNLGATLEIRDTTLPGYLSSLNELASTLVSQVNTVQSTGFGLTGGTGVDFFNPATATTPVTAANIAVGITSATDVAAASSGTDGSGDNVNAQTMANLYTTPLSMTGGTMTMGDFYDALVGQVGVDVQSAGVAQTQTTSMVSQLTAMQTSNSGVDLDQELTNLTTYQYAYQGAAKLITTASEMYDTLLSLVGAAGS